MIQAKGVAGIDRENYPPKRAPVTPVLFNASSIRTESSSESKFNLEPGKLNAINIIRHHNINTLYYFS